MPTKNCLAHPVLYIAQSIRHEQQDGVYYYTSTPIIGCCDKVWGKMNCSYQLKFTLVKSAFIVEAVVIAVLGRRCGLEVKL